MDALKELAYPGNFATRHPELHGKVAYLLHEEEVYFTAMKHGPSTINWAEQIIQAICEVEGIDWRTHSFYDVQTVWGFPASHRRLEDFCIDRLVVEDKGYPFVQAWHNVAQSKGWNGMSHVQDDVQDAVPAWVIEAFQGFILKGQIEGSL